MIDNNKKTHLIVTGRGGVDQVQADWNQTDTEQPDYIKNKPELADVATSGSYNDLTDKPTQVQADWNETDTTDPSYIQNKPTILTQWFGTQAEYDLIDPKDPNTVYHIEGGAPVQSNWNESDNTSLAYIQNKPTIPAAQVNSDWNANSGVAQILNKPNIPANTSDLTNDSGFITLNDVPSQEQADWNQSDTTAVDYIKNKPTIPVVPTNVSAFTNDAGYTTFDGDYNSLTNKPTIPAAQVNSDWNASSGVAQILNKPSIPANTSDLNNDSGFITINDVPAQVNADWNANSGVAQILNKPNITPTPPMATETLTFTLQGGTTKTIEFYTVPNYFYVEDISGSDNTLSIKGDNSNPIEIFKSTDRSNWASMGTTSSTAITATIPANSKLYIKATTTKYDGTYFRATGNYNVGGNSMSLLYGDNFDGKTTLPNSSFTLCGLFSGDTHLVNADKLELPATNITSYGYVRMFSGCSSLITAPVLPATYLGSNAYQGMFENCTSLVTAPVLPTTNNTSSQCYTNMFNGCTSLNRMVVYVTKQTFTKYCISNWLNNVAATGDFYNLGGITYPSGASGIPEGWTEHTSL